MLSVFHRLCPVLLLEEFTVASENTRMHSGAAMDPTKKWPFEHMRDVVALFTTNRYRMGALVVMSVARVSFYMYLVQVAATQASKLLIH